MNATKTYVLIFSKGKTRKIPTLSFNETYLDVCFDYVCRGVNMNYNGRFVLAKQRQYVQAQKAVYSFINKPQQLFLPIDIIFHIFDHTVVPILLHGCEVWRYENFYIIELFTWNSVEWYYMSTNLEMYDIWRTSDTN